MNFLHCNIEINTTIYKVINLEVELTVGVFFSTPMRVGSRFFNWELTVSPLYDHALVLG
jgi:hypothetical protein